MSAQTDMREVVERLRADGSEAFLELVEFHSALEAFLQNLSVIALAFHEIHAMTLSIVDAGGDGSLRLNTIQDRTGRLDAQMNRFLIAFEQLHSGVQSWNIAAARSGSSAPSSGKPLEPTD